MCIYLYICYKSKLRTLLDGGVPTVLFHRKEPQRYWKEGCVGHSDSFNGLGKRIPLPVSRIALRPSLLNFIKICSVKHAYQRLKGTEINRVMWSESTPSTSQQKCSSYKSAPSLLPQLKELIRLETQTPAPDQAAPLSGRHDNTPLQRVIWAHDPRPLLPCATPDPGTIVTTARYCEPIFTRKRTNSCVRHTHTHKMNVGSIFNVKGSPRNIPLQAQGE